MIMKNPLRFLSIPVFCMLILSGCRSTYYSAMEHIGIHKRDLLRDNVQEARVDQKEASEQFKDALTRLKEVYSYQGGSLEDSYNKLKDEYDKCSKKAQAVSSRIDKVEQIADDLFAEWKGEIKTISSSSLRDKDEAKLKETKRKFDNLRDTMRKAEKRMKPVLTELNDQVLYLKHNLNAQAIGSLKGETEDIEKEVKKLIQDMNASITEADSFIKTLDSN